MKETHTTPEKGTNISLDKETLNKNGNVNDVRETENVTPVCGKKKRGRPRSIKTSHPGKCITRFVISHSGDFFPFI